MLRQRQACQVLGAMGPQLLVRYQQATTVEHRSTSTCLSSLSNSSTSASSAAAAGAGAWVAFCEVAQILFSRKLKGQEPKRLRVAPLRARAPAAAPARARGGARLGSHCLQLRYSYARRVAGARLHHAAQRSCAKYERCANRAPIPQTLALALSLSLSLTLALTLTLTRCSP